MHYEINVSLNGSHLFATNERSIGLESQAMQMYYLFISKFPAKEGYHVTLTKWELKGEELKSS